MTKVCKGCGQELPMDSFYANIGMKDGRLNWCKPCMVLRHRPGKIARQRKVLDYIQKIKTDRGCADCGYNAHPAALDFDHLPEFIKEHRLATMAAGMRREKIDAEIAKCEVVCANCHRIRTAERLRSGSR